MCVRVWIKVIIRWEQLWASALYGAQYIAFCKHKQFYHCFFTHTLIPTTANNNEWRKKATKVCQKKYCRKIIIIASFICIFVITLQCVTNLFYAVETNETSNWKWFPTAERCCCRLFVQSFFTVVIIGASFTFDSTYDTITRRFMLLHRQNKNTTKKQITHMKYFFPKRTYNRKTKIWDINSNGRKKNNCNIKL